MVEKLEGSASSEQKLPEHYIFQGPYFTQAVSSCSRVTRRWPRDLGKLSPEGSA